MRCCWSSALTSSEMMVTCTTRAALVGPGTSKFFIFLMRNIYVKNSDSCFCSPDPRLAWGPRCCPCYITPLLAVYFIKLPLMVANWPAACRICSAIVDGSAGAHWRPESADCMSANSLWQWPQWDQTSRSGNSIQPEDYRPLVAGLLPTLTTVTPRFSIMILRKSELITWWGIY